MKTEYIQNFTSGKATYIAICEKSGNRVLTELHRGRVSNTPVMSRNYNAQSLKFSTCAEAIWADFQNGVKKSISQRIFEQSNDEE